MIVSILLPVWDKAWLYTSAPTAEIDDGLHGASTLYWSSTKFVIFIATHFMCANVGKNSIYELFKDGMIFA